MIFECIVYDRVLRRWEKREIEWYLWRKYDEQSYRKWRRSLKGRLVTAAHCVEGWLYNLKERLR